MYRVIRGSDGAFVPATIRPACDDDKLCWTREWAPLMPPDAEDQWDWPEFMDWGRFMPAQFACYSLIVEGELQGLRLLEVSKDEVEQYGTHALRLSTAPWNRPPERRYRGVGSLLVAIGLRRSLEDGHRGQMHCSSLPGAEDFHEGNGMTRFNGLDIEGLARYRFTEDATADFLGRLRTAGLLES